MTTISPQPEPESVSSSDAQQRRETRAKVIALVIAVAVVFGAGFGTGYLVYQSKVNSAEGAAEARGRELETTQANLAKRKAQVEQFLAEIGEGKVERTQLEGELQITEATLADLQQQLKEVQAALDSAQVDLTAKLAALEEAQGLESQVRELQTTRQNLDTAVALQAEILELTNDQVNPTLGDAVLLAQRGFQAVNNQNYDNSVIFFDDAAGVFETATKDLEETVTKNETLGKLVSPGLEEVFSTTVRHSKANVRVTSARSAEFRAAANLYRVIAEWSKTEGPSSQEQLKRWEALTDKAEKQIEEAMTHLDEATSWAPDLWRQFEAQRVDVRAWQSLADGVRFFILQ